jgi:S1-C subfamily serine protease
MTRRNIGIITAAVAFLLMGFAQVQAQQQPTKRDPNAGFLGVKLESVSEDLQKQLKLETQGGIVVLDVVPNSPAEKSGLKKFDVILKVDGKEFEDREGFVEIMEQTKPNQQVKFSIIREGKADEVTVTLGTRPADMMKPQDEDNDHDHDQAHDNHGDKHDGKGPSTKPG